jgi:hypothetical protein
MQRLDEKDLVRPSATAHSYLQVLKENKTFDRMVDAYLFAAAYAIKKDRVISDITLSDRQDLIPLSQIDEQVRLALEAGLHIRCRSNYLEPADGKELLEILCKYAEVGLQELKTRWQGKTYNQIQVDIQRIIGG